VHLDEEPAAYKVNAGQSGFYRTLYRDADALHSLSPFVERGDLPPEDRWGLQNDLYALVRSGQVGIGKYLQFLESYRNEVAYLPLMSVGANLLQSYLLLKGPSRRSIASIGKTILENGLGHAGFDPLEDEPFTVSLMRDQVILPAVLFGAQSIAERAHDIYRALTTKGEPAHPDIYRAVLQVAALRGASEELDWLLNRFRRSEIEHERLNILSALGCFVSSAEIERALQFALEEVPERNTFIPIVAMANNPAALQHLWIWYREHRGALERLHPLLYERIVAAVFPVMEGKQADEVKEFCEEYLRERPHMRDVMKLSLERLEINLRFRKNNRE
jgi:tricorn protease interacting factor F2/3